MKVSEIMCYGVECARPEDTIQTAAQKMRELDVGDLPVCDQDELVGMLTDRDITIRAVAKGHDPKKFLVRDCMTPKVITCFADQGVSEAARLMRDNKIRRLVVLDRNEQL